MCHDHILVFSHPRCNLEGMLANQALANLIHHRCNLDLESMILLFLEIQPPYPVIVPSSDSFVPFGPRDTESKTSSRGGRSHRRRRHHDVSVSLPPPTGWDEPQPTQEHNFGEFMSFHFNPNEPRAMPSPYVHEYRQDSNDDYVPRSTAAFMVEVVIPC